MAASVLPSTNHWNLGCQSLLTKCNVIPHTYLRFNVKVWGKSTFLSIGRRVLWCIIPCKTPFSAAHVWQFHLPQRSWISNRAMLTFSIVMSEFQKTQNKIWILFTNMKGLSSSRPVRTVKDEIFFWCSEIGLQERTFLGWIPLTSCCKLFCHSRSLYHLRHYAKRSRELPSIPYGPCKRLELFIIMNFDWESSSWGPRPG